MMFRISSLIVVATLFGTLFWVRGADGQGSGDVERRSDQEVAALVDRCFAGYLRYDNRTLKRSFIEGDFDGDGSKDLFAAVQLAKKVNTNDKSKPPFIYQEVLDSTSPSSAALDLRLGNLGTVEVWPLFVVIRNVDKPAQKRCLLQNEKYLLLFPMDKGVSDMKLFMGQKLPAGTIGDPKEDDPPPALKGGAVLLLDPAGDGQAIFWGGGRFRWYPVNDFPDALPPKYRA
jgi:hypothetical protein